MPLSSLSTVNTALNNIRDVNKNIKLPLDVIEERRAARSLEELEKFKAQTGRMSAQEGVDAGMHARKATDASQAYAAKGPQLDQSSPEAFANSLRERAAYLIMSPFPDLQQKGMNLTQQLPTMIQTGGRGTGTMTEEAYGADIDLTKAQAENQYAQARGTGGHTPTSSYKQPEPSEVAKGSEAVQGYIQSKLRTFIPQIELDKEGAPTNLNTNAFDMFAATVEGVVNQKMGNLPKGTVDRNLLASTYEEVARNYKIIHYDPFGFTNEYVPIPKNVYEAYKKLYPKDSDNDIAEKYLLRLQESE